MPFTPASHTELFRFSSQALPDEELHVIRFSGEEGINTLFRFTLELVSRNLSLDTGKLLSDRATFRIRREGGPDAVFSGYPARVEQSGAFNGYAYYTVELRPALWKTTRIVQSRIFLNQTLRDTVEELLRSQRFFSFPHTFEFARNDYPRREFAMQHDESFYNYLAWRLEDQGAYYYFGQGEEEDTIHFADAPIAHRMLEHTPTLFYAPVSGLEGQKRDEVLTSFTLSETQLPKQVVIRSYSWQNPNKPIVGFADVSADGLGDVYLAGEDVESDAEATRLAQIRAEELRCHARRFSGAGSVPGMRPGYVFKLESHYNPKFNQDYLVTRITHEGSQESFINLGLGIPLNGVTDHLFYRNQFTCIEAKTPYRPERKAPRARISGVIHAFTDGASDGSRPEIDDYGRYKILFPFDVSGRKEGKASCWVRRAQEQVGQNSGMSFPLLNGTEVLVSFKDGNPDRPYITGALANVETGALTGNVNKNISGISTAGGNRLVFNDSPKKQGVGLLTPSGSGLVMSAGSLDLSMSKSSFAGDVAALGSTSVASIWKETYSGNTILQEVMSPSTYKYLFPALEAAQEVLATWAEQLQEDSPEETTAPIALATVKSALMLAAKFGETLAFKKDRSSIYGFTVRSGGGDTMTKLQTPKNLADLLISCVMALSKPFAEYRTQLSAIEEDEEKARKDAEDKGKVFDEEEYRKTHKDPAVTIAFAQDIEDLIAEMTAIIVAYKLGANLDKETMGGILLHAEDANIGLHAKDAIHLDTAGGLLLRSGKRCNTELEENYVDPVRSEPILKWGSNDRKLPGCEIGTLFNFYNSKAMAYVFNRDVDKAEFQHKGFLADVSNLRYTDTRNLVEHILQVRKSLAGKHIVVSGENDNGSALVIQHKIPYQTDNSIQAPSNDTGIYLSVKGSHKLIRLDGNTFSVTLNDNSVEVKKKDGGYPSVKVGENQITLVQSDSTSVTMTAKQVETKAGNSTVTVKDGEIKLQNAANKYTVGNFNFSASDISNAQGRLTLSGNAISII